MYVYIYYIRCLPRAVCSIKSHLLLSGQRAMIMKHAKAGGPLSGLSTLLPYNVNNTIVHVYNGCLPSLNCFKLFLASITMLSSLFMSTDPNAAALSVN